MRGQFKRSGEEHNLKRKTVFILHRSPQLFERRAIHISVMLNALLKRKVHELRKKANGAE